MYFQCDSFVTTHDKISMTKWNSPLGKDVFGEQKCCSMEHVFHFVPWRHIPHTKQALNVYFLPLTSGCVGMLVSSR